MGPDPWSSLTSGGYCIQLAGGKFLASTDVVVEHSDLGEDDTVDLVVQERFQGDQQPAEAPRRRLRYKQGVPQLARLELGSNSGESSIIKVSGEQEQLEAKRLLQLYQNTSKVL